MPTVAEINAAFDAIEPDLHQVVTHFVPFFFQSQAMAALDGKPGRDAVLHGVTKGLEAAERVRQAATHVIPGIPK